MPDAALFKDITRYNAYAMAGELPYSSDRAIGTYKKMRNHPIISMGLSFTMLGLADTPRIVECEDEEIAVIVDRMLDPIWKRLLRDSFENIIFGFKPFEIRYEPGMVKYRMDAKEKKPREYSGIILKQPRALDPEYIKIQVDKDGSLIGFKQLWSSSPVLVEDKKCLLVVHQLESGNYYGMSALESIYSTWYIHSINMQFHTRWLERKGTGLFVGRYPVGLQDDGTENSDVMISLLDSIMEGTTIALPSGFDADGKQMWDISILDPGDKTDAFLSFHEYLDKTMLRGLIIPERALTQGEIGARASVEAFTDMFVQRKQDILDTNVDFINKYLVRPLVELNWGKDIEVNVKADRISDDSKATAFRIVESLINGRELEVDPEWLVDKTGIPVWLREKMEEPEPVVDEEPELPDTGEDVPEVDEEGTPIPPSSSVQAKPSDEGVEAKLAEDRWWAITAREKKFKLDDADIWFSQRSRQFQTEINSVIDSIESRAISYLTKYIGATDDMKLVAGLNVPDNVMRRVITQYLNDVSEYAYTMYEDAVVSGGMDFSEMSRFIGFRSSMVVDKLASDMLSALKYTVAGSLSKSLAPGQIFDSIRNQFDDFKNNRIPIIAETEIGMTISKARDTFIQDLGKMIRKGDIGAEAAVDRMQYSAILDEKTCPLCRKLNGLIVRGDSAIVQQYNTPLHYHSRSVWMPITAGEVMDPEVEDTDLTLDPRTGKPFTVDGVTAWIGDLIQYKTFD